VTEKGPRHSTRSGARLPAILLLVLVAIAAGGTAWLVLSPPPQPDTVVTKNPASKPLSSKVTTKPSPSKPSAAKAAPSGAKKTPPPQMTEPKAAATPKQPTSVPQQASPEKIEAKPSAPLEKLELPPAKKTVPAINQKSVPPHGPVAPPLDSIAAPIIPYVQKLSVKRRERPLRPAPDPALIEKSSAGPLPIVGRDGREAWRVYARPFNAPKSKPRIAIVLYGLGTSATASRAAIQGLPGAITLAFSPYADRLTGWVREARTAGHEVMLMVPMEPTNYPQFNPGRQALLTSLSDKQNIGRLEWILGRSVGYVGVVNYIGSRFMRSHTHKRLFLATLRKRGLLYLESHNAMRNVVGDIARTLKLPFAATTLQLDQAASRLAIDSQLRETERLARRLGHAVAMGFPYPVTLERIGKWAKTVKKRGFVLAPVSAISKRSPK
jgi:polysaccharide deacetylase 2 family uncharacterized protein YibQ